MGKRHRRLRWWPKPWEYRQAEAWLEDLAAKGWRLQIIGLIFAKFRRVEPESIRYRCVLHDSSITPQEEESLIGTYKDAGWRYIGYKGDLKVFECDEHTETMTDPTDSSLQEKYARLAIRNRTIRLIVSFIVYIVGFCFLYPRDFDSLSLVMESEIFFLLLSLCFFHYWLCGAREIVSYMQSKKNDLENSIRRKPSGLSSFCWAFNIILLLIMFMPGLGYISKTYIEKHVITPRYSSEDMSAFAGVNLASESEFQSYGFERFGVLYPHYRYEVGSFYRDSEDNAKDDSTLIFYNFEEYQTLLPISAMNLADMRSRCIWWFGIYPKIDRGEPSKDTMGFDLLWRYDEEDDHSIIALDGNRVYCIAFYGPVTSDQLVKFLLEKVIDPSKQ